MDPLITLTTDFGEDSPYVAAMKGVILGINPAARLVDLSHQIPPQDVRHAAFFLAEALPYFPPGVIHVVVVDPGVGSERALLCIEAGGSRLLAPDNGCWTLLSGPFLVRRLTASRYWRQPVSHTFHGRDILAPVAAHLSLGVEPGELGEPVTEWVRLDLPGPVVTAGYVRGEVVFVDGFGNLITNISSSAFAGLAQRSPRISVGRHEVARQVRTYAEAERGTLVSLVSSTEMLEIAVVQGNAARTLGVGVGTEVTVSARANPVGVNG